MHNIEQAADGSYNFAFTGERNAVWHRLGREIPDNLTPAEIQAVAGADWQVCKVPLTGEIGDEKITTGHSALVRDSDFAVLDVVPSTWNAVQNDEAFQFFDDFVKAGKMKMDTAGVLNNGKIVWALAKVDDSFELFGGDKVESYLLFSNPHMFGRCVDIKFTPTRVVCNNTLTYALSEVSEHQVRHSHRSVFDGDRVKQTLGMSHARLERYKDLATFLGSKRYTDESMKDYFNRIFPVLTQKRESRKDLSKQAQRAVEIVETQPGAEYAPGTMWQLFNAATFITNHEYGRNDNSRLNSLWFGANAGRNRKALDTAVEMASAE